MADSQKRSLKDMESTMEEVIQLRAEAARWKGKAQVLEDKLIRREEERDETSRLIACLLSEKRGKPLTSLYWFAD